MKVKKKKILRWDFLGHLISVTQKKGKVHILIIFHQEFASLLIAEGTNEKKSWQNFAELMDSSQYATMSHWIMVFCTLSETTVIYKTSLDSLTLSFSFFVITSTFRSLDIQKIEFFFKQLISQVQLGWIWLFWKSSLNKVITLQDRATMKLASKWVYKKPCNCWSLHNLSSCYPDILWQQILYPHL